MKRTLIKTTCFLIVSILISSCAIHSGIMNGSASLNSNNFKIVKFAAGKASTTKVFGIGGLGKQGLVVDAKKNLLENNPLKDGQALANVTVDFKTSYYFIVYRTTVTVTADIIEFK